MVGEKGFLSMHEWPSYDEEKTVDSTVEIAVQINGKVRATVSLPVDCDKETAIGIAKQNETVATMIDGKTIVKEIVVPGRIVNIVVK